MRLGVRQPANLLSSAHSVQDGGPISWNHRNLYQASGSATLSPGGHVTWRTTDIDIESLEQRRLFISGILLGLAGGALVSAVQMASWKDVRRYFSPDGHGNNWSRRLFAFSLIMSLALTIIEFGGYIWLSEQQCKSGRTNDRTDVEHYWRAIRSRLRDVTQSETLGHAGRCSLRSSLPGIWTQP
jgi:hypothetical protein